MSDDTIDQLLDSIINPSQKKVRKEVPLLERFYDPDSTQIELCIDEVGRGCLFGRVYVACVVLPKDPKLFNGKDIKDSKKFSSKKKLKQIAEYIKENALTWNVSYVDEDVVDKINILKSVMQGMHSCIRNTIVSIQKMNNTKHNLDDYVGIIDGNYFTPFRSYDMEKREIVELSAITVEKGDGKYMGIAAASILAKCARDAYIEDMCKKYPILDERYGLSTNMGYGTKVHIRGIKEYGITQWHRRTFGCCNDATLYQIESVDSTDDENESNNNENLNE